MAGVVSEKLSVLSGFYLAEETNALIASAVADLGWSFLGAPRDMSERVEHVTAHIDEADILYAGRLMPEQWERASRLRWIHVPWAGVNTLLATEGIASSDVIVTNSSGIMADSVADQTLATMLILSRDLASQVRSQDRREWARYETESPKRQVLRGKTLGILGFGAIGRAVAVRARAFGMRVIATKRHADTKPPELDAVHGPEAIDTVLAESDAVVVALPLTRDTNGMLDRARLALMKPTAHLINISRGAVVVEADLIDALEYGVIAAAALDVFEKEPLPSDSRLWSMPNVIVTPHSSGGFMGFGEASARLFIENLNRFASGDELRNVVRDGY